MHSALPKVLHTIAGRPMLRHVVDSARQLGPSRLIVVDGHESSKLRSALSDDDIVWRLQADQLGTGHAVLAAAPALDDTQPTLVLYGDVPLIEAASLRNLLAKCTPQTVALMTLQTAQPQGYGRIVRDAAGEVTAIVEERDATEAQKRIGEVNTGILAAPTLALKRWLGALRNDNAQSEYYLTDIIAAAVADGLRVQTCQPGHDWEVLGVNSRAQQAQLERVYQRRQAERLMDEGVSLMDPARIDIRGSLTCGRDVFIDVGCVFEGKVHLADGVQLGPYCVLKNVDIGVGSKLAAYTHCEQATVGEQATIGPFARLRPGAALAGGVHIGNFVEIKNSTLAANSKVNHLSYIGDADIGERVNIGAGTITCNYDGVHKHRTIIGRDAFIGSDCQLIAPVTVGEGATLGAGTTLTQDAPAHKLTVARSAQVTIDNWQRSAKPFSKE